MTDIRTLLILIPALPLAAAVLTALLGKRVLRERSHMPTVAALLLSFLASMVLIFQMGEQIASDRQAKTPPRIGHAETFTLWQWADLDAAPLGGAETPAQTLRQPNAGRFDVGISLQADPLTAVMLAMVTCISALVAVYSIGYMRGDPGYWRFFTYISLFVFAMTMLVASSNFLLLYVFWELVGLCSYLLIGFWFEKPAAAAAGKKAFLVNRIGDFGFALGIFLIWTTYGTLNFHDVLADGHVLSSGVLGQSRLAAGLFATDWRAAAIGLLLLMGACGKSAQFPLHVWLPDAMEGPTPVSALIHAATMVTAGVYMIARCMPLYAASVEAQYAVAAVGGITALLGAIIAITQTDLKRILAYSTISHLGYMFVAMGTATTVGAIAGMFHLVTHAFFKALLFLGAGSVMHAMGGVIDIRRFGGLRRRLPITHGTFLIGCLAIAGVAPLAGFWSKDAILLAIKQRTELGDAGGMFELLLASTLLGVLLIDFYMFRPFFLTFYGTERIPAEAGSHAHESPGIMTAPLIILAFGAAVIGAYFEWTHGFRQFLSAAPPLAYLPTAAHIASADHWTMGITSTLIAAVGIAAAAFIYLASPRRADRLARFMNVFGLYSLSYGKFFFDPVYDRLIVRPMLGIARLAAWFDGAAIDRLIDLCGNVPALLGTALRPLQNGLVQFYAMAMMLGLLALLGILLL